MKNADLLAPSWIRRRGQIARNVDLKPRNFFFHHESYALSALMEGNVDLGSFAENDYHHLTPTERKKAYELVTHPTFLNRHSEDYRLLKARLNPRNQYRVKTRSSGKENVYECFLFEGKFHTGAELFLKESCIVEVTRIA